MKANGTEREEISSYTDVSEDIKKRAKEKRLKKNIVIDHITNLQQEASQRYNPSLESDYGRANSKATSEWRSIRGLIKTLDCNLFVVCHIKNDWDGNKIVGVTTDGAKNIEGDMHIVLYLQKPGSAGSKVQPTKEVPSVALVKKWRRDSETDPRGLVPLTFPFTMEAFLKIAGAGMTRDRKEVELATPEQVAEVKHLLSVLKLEEKAVNGWLKKAGVDDFSDASFTAVQGFIKYCKDQILPTKEAK
jgi:hypothetical protein